MVEALAKYGFVASQLPIQISLEMHCSPPQQQKIAIYFRQMLGSMLLTPGELSDDAQLTSPEQMLRRVMIKGKVVPLLSEEDPRRRPREHWTIRLLARLKSGARGKAEGGSTLSTSASRSFSEMSSAEQLDAIDEEALEEEVHLKAFAGIKLAGNARRGGLRSQHSIAELLQKEQGASTRRASIGWLAGIRAISPWRKPEEDPRNLQGAVRLSSAEAAHVSAGASSQQVGRSSKKSPKKKARSVDPDLAAVITMPGMGIDAFMLPLDDTARKMLCVTSISEAKLQHIGSDEIIAMQRRTLRSHGRAFPLGLRTDSSNMDPWIAWRSGLQVFHPALRTAHIRTPTLTSASSIGSAKTRPPQSQTRPPQHSTESGIFVQLVPREACCDVRTDGCAQPAVQRSPRAAALRPLRAQWWIWLCAQAC